MPPSDLRSKYTKDQITQYLERLQVPDSQRTYDVSQLSDEDALKYLALLQKRHLANVPFENLTLHYSPHRQISIHPEELFKKVVGDNNGRGGYCMENNCLFGTLLYSLGYNIYPGGGRVWEGSFWTGWSHMVNLIKIGKTKYHVDVGFGGDGPIVPMPLDHSGTVQPHISPATARLRWRNIEGNLDPEQRLWVYELKRNDEADWDVKYCYTELEFRPNDYNSMNYFTSTSPKTFFTQQVVIDKKLLDENGDLAGSLILNQRTIKWRIHGVKEREIELETENDRIEALEKHFGIKLGEVERAGIRGLVSEIK